MLVIVGTRTDAHSLRSQVVGEQVTACTVKPSSCNSPEGLIGQVG